MKMVPLGEVAAINPRSPKLQHSEDVAFVGMAQLDEASAVAVPREYGPYSNFAHGYTPFEDGDILAAKITPCWENGKIGQAHLGVRYGMGSTEFHVVRPTDAIDVRYALHFIRQSKIRDTGTLRMTGSAGQRRVPTKYLTDLAIPLPPLDEQRRIAAILDKADAIRQKRRQAIAHLDTLTQSIFNEMFGEEERANFELREICTLRSGGTPSKQENGFWNGDIPWFSLKDLKHDRLTDSIDHVTERSIQQTTLRTIAKDTILVGVRGMILAHTVPISLLKVDGTINQDVKALEVTESFTPEFLHAAMKGNHSYLLSQVTTAAHGTKRLESNALLSARIPCATSAEQIDFTSKIAHWAAARDRIKQLASGGDQLFASVQSRAFRGEL
ncbi:restriction endonuclease subunit S [Brevibacterium picturae]|uniref:Type I restriction modification DNA specificity domain-containing protein n=1 Tax=Brevibacterium picturae TaxID=260553 RepID=A0ABP4M8L4_9MICO